MDPTIILADQPPYLKCSICGKVMREPCECPQQHPFCFRCIKEYLTAGDHSTCPVDGQPLQFSQLIRSPLAENLIAAVPCCCPFKSRGCVWKGKSSDYDTHVSTCKFAPPPVVAAAAAPQPSPAPAAAVSPATQHVQHSSPLLSPPPPNPAPVPPLPSLVASSAIGPSPARQTAPMMMMMNPTPMQMPMSMPTQMQMPTPMSMPTPTPLVNLSQLPPVIVSTQQQQQQLAAVNALPLPPEPAPVVLSPAPPPVNVMLQQQQQQQQEEETVTCMNPGCLATMKKSQLKSHLQKCPAAIIPCPFAGCQVKLARKDMLEKHVMEMSPMHLLSLYNSVQSLHSRLDRLVGTTEEMSTSRNPFLLAWDLSRSSPHVTISPDGSTAKICGTVVSSPDQHVPKQWYPCVANNSFTSGSIFWELVTQATTPEDCIVGLCPDEDVEKLVSSGNHVGIFGCAIDLFTGRLFCRERSCQPKFVAVPVPLGGFSGKKIGFRLDIGGDSDGTLCLIIGSSTTVVFSNLNAFRSALVPVVCAASEGKVMTLVASDRSPPARETLLSTVNQMQERLEKIELLSSVTKPTLTWDPSRCASTLLLSEGNLRVTCSQNITQGSAACLGAGRGFFAGRAYWELSLIGHAWVGISFADHAASVNVLGNDTMGCAMYTGDGTLRARKPIQCCMEKFPVPLSGWEKQRIGLLLDCNEGTMSFTCNGKMLGMAFEKIPHFTEVLPSVTLLVRGSSIRLLPFA